MEDNKKNDLLTTVKFILNKATEEELGIIIEALNKRKSRPANTGVMNGENFAKETASNLTERMGLTTDMVKSTAQKLVSDMILQYNPHIPQAELDFLINKWVPQNPPEKEKLPADVTILMAAHFVSYSLGTMSKKDIEELPEGWIEKYWHSFSEEIQKLIAQYLKNLISKDEFWNKLQFEAKK